jgi:signal transduction histidine kinase
MATATVSLAAVAHSGRAVEVAVQSSAADVSQRAGRVAEALQYLGPFPLFACLLTAGKPRLAVLDDSGSLRHDWEDPLAEILRVWAERADDAKATSTAAPAGLPPGRLLGAPIVFQGYRYGVLALGVPPGESDGAETSLGLVAAHLAAHLYGAEANGSSEDAERTEWLGNIAETTSLVAHEFNNFLNGIMLHLALMRQEAPQQMSAELDVMKRLATDAAGLVRKLQQFNGRRRPTLAPTDLNEVVREALARSPLPAGIAGINDALADDLPLVQAARGELIRILGLLLRQAAGAMQSKPGPLTLRTESTGRKVVLRFEDSGPPLSPEALPKVFEPFFLARPNAEEPGLALCHTLARRLHANMRAENRPEGGVALILEFTPTAT